MNEFRHPRLFYAIESRERLRAAGIDETTNPEIYEAETADGLEYLRSLARSALEAQTNIDAIRRRREQLEARAARFAKTNEKLREELRDGLEAMGLKKLDAPDLTVTTQAGPKKVHITDSQFVPDRLCRITKQPNLTAIRQAIEMGEDIPFAELSNGPMTVRIITG